MSANIISENLIAQVYDHGNMHRMIDEIEDRRTTKEAISLDQGTYKTKYGLDSKNRKTKIWEFYVKWRYGSGEWVAVKDLKDSYPVPPANYAISNRLQDKTVFAWWVP